MFAQAVRALCKNSSVATRRILATGYPQSSVILRGYRNRESNNTADEIKDPETAVNSDETVSGKVESDFASASLGASLNETMTTEEVEEKPESISLSSEEVEELQQETDRLFHQSTEEEEEVATTSHIRAERVTERNFEDEFFRLTDAATRQYIDDDVNDTLRTEGRATTAEPVTFVKGEDVNAFFDKILSLDANKVLSESEQKRVSVVKEESKEELKEVKRSTWFNFMPAKEQPEGPFGTYSPDQIFNALEFDLLSRNMMDVYKYEKDDMLLTEDILKHAKMPEELEAPAIPKYPNFEEYARRVTFAINRNGDYTMEDKQRVVDALKRIGELTSEVDESPKTPFKPKKYM